MLEGKPYRFGGLNIYNANSRDNCWYTMGSGPDLDTSMTQAGPNAMVIRAWFFQSLATVNGRRDWSAFDHTMAVAKAHGIRVVATLGNQWGDCEQGSPVYKTEAWYATGYRTTVETSMPATYRDWIAEVAARYRDDPNLLAWQLINEAEDLVAKGGACTPTANATLTSFAVDTSSLLKSVDQNHLVSLGTIGSGQCGANGSATAYQTLHSVATIDLCEYHDYGAPNSPIPGDRWNGLQARLNDCASIGKPLFVGESGIATTQVGSLAARAAAFASKFKAQFAAGVVGELVWDWRTTSRGGSAPNAPATPGNGDGYEVGPGDPALDALGVR
jgi:endo-1,4-beta-mannosidase